MPLKKPSEENPIKESILMRARVLYTIFVGMGVMAIVFILKTQFGSDSKHLVEQSLVYSYKNEVIEASRGDVISDDGRTLATSILYYDLRMDMEAPGLTDEIFNANIVELSDKLSAFFKDKTPLEYYRHLVNARKKGHRYLRIGNRRVDYLELGYIKTFPILSLPANKGGLMAEEISRRVNPYGTLAGRTLGFVNSVGVKVGLEGTFDNALKGVDGLTVKQKISGTFWIPIASENNIEPIHGQNIHTPINIELQDMVQLALRKKVVEAETDWGTVIVMDVKTGHIKAIANLTRTKEGKLFEDYNYAVGMSLEPGSTFKIPVIMAMMDETNITPNTLIDTEDGRVKVGYAKVVDTKIGGYGRISLAEVVEKSSNVGMAKAINKYYGANPRSFIEKINKFGLNETLGVQIKGEAKPLIKHPDDRKSWDGTTLTMMSYGYALRQTPLQTLAFYNAVANDGVMVKPQFITAISSQGVVTTEFPTDTLRILDVSNETLRKTQNILNGVVLRGTARSLQSPNYTVAAKTGTAQIAIGRSGYKTSAGGRHYLGSTAGYFPADKPKYSIIVALKTFRKRDSKQNYYGGALAAPLFKEICDYIYSIDFSLHSNNGKVSIKKPRKLSVMTADTKDLETLSKFVPVNKNYGKGEVAQVKEGTASSFNVSRDKNGVPIVVGYSPIKAQHLLMNEGYKVNIKGCGAIAEQHNAYDSITNIKTVTLILK